VASKSLARRRFRLIQAKKRSTTQRLGGRRHQRLEDFPLRVRQVASVAQALAAMLPPGGRSPHLIFQADFDDRLESHRNPAIHPKFEFQDGLSVVGVGALAKAVQLRSVRSRSIRRFCLRCPSSRCSCSALRCLRCSWVGC
jgi:hypothetical protein